MNISKSNKSNIFIFLLPAIVIPNEALQNISMKNLPRIHYPSLNLYPTPLNDLK